MTIEQMHEAWLIGVKRFDHNRSSGWEDRAVTATRETDGYAAVAEALVAEHFGLTWPGRWWTRDDPETADLAGIEVRWTSRKQGRLLLHDDDDDELLAVLVVGVPPEIKIAGAIKVFDGKQKQFWDKDLPEPCYAVPQHCLQNIQIAPSQENS